MLRGGALPAAVVGVLTVLVSAGWGARAAWGAALGSMLACAALAVGPLLVRRVATWSPPAVTGAAMGAYAATTVLLGVAFLLLSPLSWLSAEHLAGGLVAVCLAWLAGQVRAVSRLRVPAFDVSLSEVVADSDGPAQGGRPGSSSQAQR
jgi:hypothetical protein